MIYDAYHLKISLLHLLLFPWSISLRSCLGHGFSVNFRVFVQQFLKGFNASQRGAKRRETLGDSDHSLPTRLRAAKRTTNKHFYSN